MRSEDHPRIRGVHSVTAAFTWATGGSSPHARGPPDSHGYVTYVYGIILACAGSTLAIVERDLYPRDHPRMRGVHSRGYFRLARASGSSPHARGPRGSEAERREVCRDHPRMRGVHVGGSGRPARAWGSSPHARGPPAIFIQLVKEQGIIPACAGSTQRCRIPSAGYRDHPRMRGVHTKKMPKIRHFSWRYDPISFNFKNTCCVKMQSVKARCFCSSSPKCSGLNICLQKEGRYLHFSRFTRATTPRSVINSTLAWTFLPILS